MKERMRCTHTRLVFIQRRMSGLCVTKMHKVEVLGYYWDKILFKIQVDCTKKNDIKTIELCKNIIRVPP